MNMYAGPGTPPGWWGPYLPDAPVVPPVPGSNTVTQNPFLFTSAMLVTYLNDPMFPNHLQIYPRVIEWNNPTAAGHQVIITDGNGQVLFTHTAQAQYKGCYVSLTRGSGRGGGVGIRWKDFIVTTLDSGELTIWHTT